MYQMRSGALVFMLSPQVKVNVEDRYLSDSGATFAQTRTTKYIAKINVPDVIWYIDFGLLKNYEPSSPSILGIQTIPDIDLGDPNPHGH